MIVSAEERPTLLNLQETTYQTRAGTMDTNHPNQPISLQPLTALRPAVDTGGCSTGDDAPC